MMDRASKKAIIVGTAIGLSFLGLLVALNINQYGSAPRLSTAATFVRDVPPSPTGMDGGIGPAPKIFRLDSGQEIQLDPGPVVAPGQNVKIIYHKGKIFKNVIYDYYEL